MLCARKKEWGLLITGYTQLQNVLFHSFYRLFDLQSFNFLKSPLPSLLNPPQQVVWTKEVTAYEDTCIGFRNMCDWDACSLPYISEAQSWLSQEQNWKHDQWTYHMSAFCPWQWFTRGPWHTFCLGHRSLSARRPELFQHRLRMEDLKSSGLGAPDQVPVCGSSPHSWCSIIILVMTFLYCLGVIDKPRRK